MVRPIRLPVAAEHLGEPSAGPIQRVQGLAGVAILAMTVSALGLPLSGGHLATDLLLVVLGYKLTTRLRQGQYEDRNIMRFWLGHLGRVGVPMLVVLGLTVAYWSWAGVVTGTQRRAALAAMTLNLNIVEGMGGANFGAIEHLRLVALISQFALLLPVLLVLSRRLLAYQRAALLATAGAIAALCRVLVLATGTLPEEAGVAAGLTRVDGLLLGAAVAVAPLPVLRRLIPSGLAAVAFTALLGLLVAAPSVAGVGMAAVTVFSIGAAVALVMAAAGAGLVGSLSDVVDRPTVRWLGARSLSVFIWHALFGYLVFGGESGIGADLAADPTTGQWPGVLLFLARVGFTLAAAATSYRYLEVPLAAAMRRAAARLQAEDDLERRNDTIGLLVPEPGQPPLRESPLV